MPSNSEVGHAKNTANLQKLILTCVSYGTKYNPQRTSFTITAMQSLYDTAMQQIVLVADEKANFQRTANLRRELFEPVKPLSTMIMAALASSGVSSKTIIDAKSINRKIQGSRIVKKKNTNNNTAEIDENVENTETDSIGNMPTDEKSISTSQQSYDQIIESVRALIALLEKEPNYNPNEANLQVTTLKTLLNNMLEANQQASLAIIKLTTARIARNEVLYAKDTGLCDVAKNVKLYVKSIFGARSTEYKQVSKLQFRSF